MPGAIFTSARHASEITVRLCSLSKITVTVYKLPLPIVQVMANIFFYRCSVHSEIYVVHSPINALFIELGKV